MNIIGEIGITNTNKTVVSLSNYKGKDAIDVRDFFKTDKMQEWQPTKRGVRLPLNKAPELVSIFEKVEDTIKKAVK